MSERRKSGRGVTVFGTASNAYLYYLYSASNAHGTVYFCQTYSW